ncbi:helix-turn-helix domain-containing protein [Oceanospirillum beijerinckii]|uniref:helix-turn-helix domain-containing protein n=1 Tax=Oceanospirillum beijerinckii TaxID=64976 RepID=UPI000418BD7C|nr:helix-turn-helix domain-containing protein [Oceanospirillum beijerinckii]
MTTINNDNKELIKKVLTEAADNVPVEQVCEQNGISKATYYAWYSAYSCENGELMRITEVREKDQKQATDQLVKQITVFR